MQSVPSSYDFDLILLGGGKAALTLALQLVQKNPSVSIAIPERRIGPAPEAIHKVGESTSELGASYLRYVLGLDDYLDQHQLPKFGFRFFLGSGNTNDLSTRVEVGSKIKTPFRTNHMDRGLFENFLTEKLKNSGVQFIEGATIKDVTISSKGHSVVYLDQDDNRKELTSRWIVDGTGRAGFLNRHLQLSVPVNHHINSAWFRLNAKIDVASWSDNTEWKNRYDQDRRLLATNHLLGKGYWIWIIPLVNGNTSIGIVADPEVHPFETFNTFEKAKKWIAQHEPLAASRFFANGINPLDFKVMKDFSYDSKKFYSTDKWALTGESGAFSDAFYSPGMDFIGLSNSWITDLILRDIKGEDIQVRTMVYEHVHHELLKGWFTLYQNMYPVFGTTQVMLLKIVWDWCSYWAVPCVMFMNNGYTDIGVLKEFSANEPGIGHRFAQLNALMQQSFLEASKWDWNALENKHINVFDLTCMFRLQTELNTKTELPELMSRISKNLDFLEELAAEIIRKLIVHRYQLPENVAVNPYHIWYDENGNYIAPADDKASNPLHLPVREVQEDIDRVWFVTETVL